MVLCQSPEEVRQDVTSIVTQACCVWLLVVRKKQELRQETSFISISVFVELVTLILLIPTASIH